MRKELLQGIIDGTHKLLQYENEELGSMLYVIPIAQFEAIKNSAEGPIEDWPEEVNKIINEYCIKKYNIKPDGYIGSSEAFYFSEVKNGKNQMIWGNPAHF